MNETMKGTVGKKGKGGKARKARKPRYIPIDVDSLPSITIDNPDNRKTSIQKAAEDASQATPTKLTP